MSQENRLLFSSPVLRVRLKLSRRDMMYCWLLIFGVWISEPISVLYAQERQSEDAAENNSIENRYEWGDLLTQHSRTDQFGDPIPFGAWTRLGSNRLTHYGYNIDQHVAYSASTQRLVTLSFDSLRIWDSESGKLIFIESVGDRTNLGVCLLGAEEDSESRLFAVWQVEIDKESRDQIQCLRIHQLENGMLVRETKWNFDLPAFDHFCVSSDAARSVVFCQRGKVVVFDQSSATPVFETTVDYRAPLVSFDSTRGVAHFAEAVSRVEFDAYPIYRLDLNRMRLEIEEVASYTRRTTPIHFDAEPAVVSLDDNGDLRVTMLESGAETGVDIEPGWSRILNVFDTQADPALIAGVDNDTGRASIRVIDLRVAESSEVSIEDSRQRIVAGDLDTGHLWATSYADRYVRWTLDGRETLTEKSLTDTMPIRRLLFSHDGEKLYSLAEDGVRVWEPNTGELLDRFSVGWPLREMAISPDGRWMAITQNTGKVYIWSLQNRRVVHELAWEMDESVSEVPVAFTSDSASIVTFSYDCVLRSWNVETGELERELLIEPRSTPALNSRSITESDRHYFAAKVQFFDGAEKLGGFANGSMQFFETTNGNAIGLIPSPGRQFACLPGDTAEMFQAVFVYEEDERRNVLQVINPFTGEVSFQTEEFNNRSLESLAAHPNGRIVQWREKVDGHARLEFWDIRANHQLRRIRLPESMNVGYSTFAPGGQWFAITTEFNDILVWKTDELFEADSD